MIKFFRLILFALLFFHVSLTAQYDNLKFKHLNSNDGLSQNFISCILQDKTGFLWFGTKDGLNRYDGYNFKVYRHDPFDITSVSGNFILSMYEDSKGRLWIGTDELNLFLPDINAFKRVNLKLKADKKNNQNKFDRIISITEDKYGLLWIGTDNGLIYYNPETDSSEMYFLKQDDNSVLSDNFISSLSSDDSLIIIGTHNGMKLLNIDLLKDGKFKLGKISHLPPAELINSKRSVLTQLRTSDNIIYAGTPSGLLKINISTGESDYIPYKGIVFSPQWLNRILSICQDKNGNLWLASSGSLIIYNPVRNNFKYYFHNPKDEQSLSMNSITSVYADRGGKIWTGTAGKGINLFDQNRKDFSLYNGFIDREPFKSSFSVSNIFSDSKNLLWVSSQEKLFRINRETGEYTKVNLLYGEEGEITSVLEDGKQNIWVSSGGGLYKITGSGIIKHYSHNPLYPNSLRNNFVRLLFIDNKEKLYVLNSAFLSKYNEDTESFTHYELSFIDNKKEPVIRCIYKIKENEFWFGWSEGLVRYDLNTREKKIFKHQPGNNRSISNNEVLTICEDPNQPKKYLWVGTLGGGLSRLNLEDGTFANFSVDDGLPNNVVYSILSSGNELWLSTNNGLCRVKIDKYGTPSFRNYEISDGLQGNEFNTGAYYKSHTGELFFGGLNGVNAFFSEDIRDNIYIPPVVITELQFLKQNFDEKESSGSTRNILSKNSSITIPYSKNSFNIQFAALDFTATEKNQYMYKLKPINDHWINLGIQRNVTFTELRPGEYELIVRGSNNDGVWNEEGASLTIIITPPFWETTWAYAFYFLVLLFVLYVLRKYEMNRLQLKNRLKQEYFETQKLKELDELKSGFFANISHEFRTPLTLIIGPSEQLEAEETDHSKKYKLGTIRKNASRLLRLINQILDLSKLEKGSVKISFSEGNMVEFLKMIFMSFATIAEKKRIQLKFIPDQHDIPVYFSKDTIEKIFYNLISNAFKFTPPGGTIEVSISGRTNNIGIKSHCLISVKDSGIGIPENELSKVFTKFYQVSSAAKYSDHGSGIGLALVKELVELHYGEVKVESRLNEGTTFSVLLPLGKGHLKPDQLQVDEKLSATPSDLAGYQGEVEDNSLFSEKNIIRNSPEVQNGETLIVLVVEDNTNVRKYISEYLGETYRILEADNGRDGFEKAIETIPDIIISDVMMPGMNGYDLCRKLKTDERTSHIPVILLTAKAGDADKMEGLETGADDYLTKPFNSKELLIRVKNLIEIRQKLRKKFSSSLVIKPKEITSSSIDKLFIEKALLVVEQNISNENFSVMDLSSKMNLSHSQLHRKLKALLNKSANQFIRSVKMQKALELLKSKAGTIAEIGYQVGYNDPSYFTRAFSTHFGYLPSEVKRDE